MANQLDLTPFTKGFVPVYVQPWFMAVNGVTLLVLAAGYVTHRRRERLANDPSLAAAREHQRAVRVELDLMGKAQAAGDNAAFFTAARRALQQALARKWKLRPADISLTAIQARHAELAESVAPVYAMADEAAYGGQIATQVALADWDKAVREQLRYIDSNL